MERLSITSAVCHTYQRGHRRNCWTSSVESWQLTCVCVWVMYQHAVVCIRSLFCFVLNIL